MALADIATEIASRRALLSRLVMSFSILSPSEWDTAIREMAPEYPLAEAERFRGINIAAVPEDMTEGDFYLRLACHPHESGEPAHWDLSLDRAQGESIAKEIRSESALFGNYPGVLDRLGAALHRKRVLMLVTAEYLVRPSLWDLRPFIPIESADIVRRAGAKLKRSSLRATWNVESKAVKLTSVSVLLKGPFGGAIAGVEVRASRQMRISSDLAEALDGDLWMNLEPLIANRRSAKRSRARRRRAR